MAVLRGADCAQMSEEEYTEALGEEVHVSIQRLRELERFGGLPEKVRLARGGADFDNGVALQFRCDVWLYMLGVLPTEKGLCAIAEKLRAATPRWCTTAPTSAG